MSRVERDGFGMPGVLAADCVLTLAASVRPAGPPAGRPKARAGEPHDSPGGAYRRIRLFKFVRGRKGDREGAGGVG